MGLYTANTIKQLTNIHRRPTVCSMREYRRWQEPISCECGFQIKCATGLAQHLRSVLHCRTARLRALLDSCLNFSIIGRRLGVSRERVRQLASNLGYKPGRERRTLCALKKREREQIEFPMIAALKQACPYRVELICRPSARGDRRFFSTEVMILGKRCAIHKAGYRGSDTVHFNYSRGFSGHCEFSVVLIPDGRWVVCRSLKSADTCFKLGERLVPGNPGVFHGWNDRIGAWHTLEG